MAVTLIAPEEVWIDDACTLQLQRSGSSTSDADNQVTLTFSMYENSGGGSSPDYTEYNLEATYDGWIDGAITVSFRDFARAAWDNGFEYIQVRQTSGSSSSSNSTRTILLHDGIRTCETIVPLHEYRVAKEGDTAPIFFIGDDLRISGTGLENSCFPGSGNTAGDNTISTTSPLEPSGGGSGGNANDRYRYACVEAHEGVYMFSGGGADRTVRVKALDPCYGFSARWTGQLGFTKAWAFELSSEKLSPSDNVDFYDPDTIGYPHRAGYEMEIGGIARNLTKEQRRYLADIATANDLTVEWIKEAQPARVGTAPSISLTAQLGDVSVTFKLIKVMF